MEMRQRAAGRPRPGRGGWERLAAALVAAAGLFAGARPATANITIKGPTNHTASADISGVPKGVKATVSLDPDPVTYLNAAAAGGLLDKTFQADLKQSFPGWTLNFAGAGLGGTLQIDTYSARDFGGGAGGATMDATYTPDKKDPANLTFTQVFVANAVTGRGTHVDPFPNSYKEPFYYNADERKKHGLHFNDNPQSPVRGVGQNSQKTFYTYLVSFDAAKKTLTAYDGWEWGYKFDVVKAGGGGDGGSPSPEPGTMTLLAIGGGCLAWARRRSRIEAEGSPC
jgi:hypothetical protein